MPINVTIGNINAPEALPQEVALALRAYEGSIILPNQSIYPPATPIPQGASDSVTFDALLIKTAENTWHIVDNTPDLATF